MNHSMKSRGQTRNEAFDQTESLSSQRHPLRRGTWNVITLIESGRVAQVIDQMGRYRLNNLSINEEVRWPGSSVYFKMTIISCYSPTNEAEEEDED